MPETPPVVRAVVVTWNGAALLPTALDSLLSQDVDIPMEVLVVDNASTDGTAELLRSRYPSVTVVTAPENLGFAGGAALGMRDSDAAYVALLNNDARFEPHAVQALLDAMRRGEPSRVAAVTALVLLEPGDDDVLVNSTGTQVSAWGAGVDRDWLVPRGDESTTVDVFGFNGGACLLRADAVRSVGGFDPELFLYYEDTDLSWRLRGAGWTIRYESSAVAWHRHASSSGVDSPVFRYHNTRNSLIVVGRHAPLQVVAASALRQALGLVRAALRAGPVASTTRARARGLGDAFRRTSKTFRERGHLWRHATVSRRAVWVAARARSLPRASPTG